MEKTFDLIAPLESGGAGTKPIGLTFMRIVNAAMGAITPFFVADELGDFAIMALLPFFVCDIILVHGERRRAVQQLLAFYSEVKEPILEWQQSPTDSEVFNRAVRHRELLVESKNCLFELKKIEVVEMYWKDGDYVETFEEFEARRQDIKRDYLREWSRTVSQDALWRKQFLYNQRIEVKEAQAA